MNHQAQARMQRRIDAYRADIVALIEDAQWMEARLNESMFEYVRTHEIKIPQ